MLVGEKLDIIIEGYSSYCVASSRPPLGETPEPESAASGLEFSNYHIDISTSIFDIWRQHLLSAFEILLTLKILLRNYLLQAGF